MVNPDISEPGLVHTVVEVSRDHFTISRCGGDQAWDKIMDLATESRRAIGEPLFMTDGRLIPTLIAISQLLTESTAKLLVRST